MSGVACAFDQVLAFIGGDMLACAMNELVPWSSLVL